MSNLGMLHCVIVFLILILLIYILVKSWPYWKSKKWVKVNGEIININEKYVNVALSMYQNIKYFYPDIKYKYNFQGKTYVSDRVSFEVENIWIPEVNKWGNTLDKKMLFVFLDRK